MSQGVANTRIYELIEPTLTYFDFFSKKCVKELVATVNSIDTSIAFRKGLNSSTIKKIITIAIAIIK